MVQTCENTYSSSWLKVIKNSFGKSKYNVDQKELCVQKAGHFKTGVETGGEENYTGNEKWCEDPCVVQYLLGTRKRIILIILLFFSIKRFNKMSILFINYLHYR